MENKNIKGCPKFCPDKQYLIEFLILKNFIAAIKKRGMYVYFRRSVGICTNNPASNLYMSINSCRENVKHDMKDNPFINAGNMLEFLQIMVSVIGKRGEDIKNEKEMQYHISNGVNMLLHVFIENHNNNFDFLCQIGEEIFNATCQDIYGKDFQDMTKQISKEDISKLKAFHEAIASNPRCVSKAMISEMMEVFDRYRDESLETFRPNLPDEDLDLRLDWEELDFDDYSDNTAMPLMPFG